VRRGGHFREELKMNSLASKILFSALTLSLATGAAFAADLPTHKAPAPPPVYAPAFTWTGFYIGVNGGYGGDAYRYPFALSATPRVAGPVNVNALAAVNDPGINGSAKLNSSGFLGGGTAGFNWQFAPTWVAGVEGDIDFADINGKLNLHASSNTTPDTLDVNAGSKTSYFDTARVRLGYLVTPQFLIYGTGGAAFADTQSTVGIKFDGADILGGPYSKTVNSLGWTAGAGVEYKITKNLSFKTEYLYADLGTKTLLSGTVAPISYSLKVHTTDNLVRAGLNWSFN
jgi:outer membrane immunogenic protein